MRSMGEGTAAEGGGRARIRPLCEAWGKVPPPERSEGGGRGGHQETLRRGFTHIRTQRRRRAQSGMKGLTGGAKWGIVAQSPRREQQ